MAPAAAGLARTGDESKKTFVGGRNHINSNLPSSDDVHRTSADVASCTGFQPALCLPI
jgi:hypothetical protein